MTSKLNSRVRLFGKMLSRLDVSRSDMGRSKHPRRRKTVCVLFIKCFTAMPIAIA